MMQRQGTLWLVGNSPCWDPIKRPHRDSIQGAAERWFFSARPPTLPEDNRAQLRTWGGAESGVTETYWFDGETL